ncbi:transmembrane protein 186-like [Oppia nitens]|uniref:transmembrane protein 186-like n=1 Tax=Oppia nitens TaxID=1686743 RepID=UPI0023DBCE71|nr:transmembrane protein 186-like [Oppia nitens]
MLSSNVLNRSLNVLIGDKYHTINGLKLTTSVCRYKSRPFGDNHLKLLALRHNYLMKYFSRDLSSQEDKLKSSDVLNKTLPTKQTSVAYNLNDSQKSDDQSSGLVGIQRWKTGSHQEVKQWITIYQFPYIYQLRSYQRVKLWMSVLSVILVPTTYVFYAIDLIPLDACNTYTIMGFFSVSMLYVIGYMFRHFVGRIYISNDNQLVRLGHLTFFGNRKDIEIQLSDVVPLIDSNNQLDDWFCRIEQYSCNNQWFISLKFGGIKDQHNFDKVFGKK